jgi:hypothetical protein
MFIIFVILSDLITVEAALVMSQSIYGIPYESTKVAKSTKVADTQNHESHS